MAAETSSSNHVSNPPLVKEEIIKQDASSEAIEANKEVDTVAPVQEITEVKEELIEDKIEAMDHDEQLRRSKKSEADFRQHLMAKYFSDKNVFGGNIFDVKVNIDGLTATASRLPPYQSYLNPATFPETLRKDSSFSAEASMIGSSE